MRPDQTLGASKLPRIPRNAPQLDCFRIHLNSHHRLSGTTRDAVFNLDFPVEIGDGYHISVESVLLSGGTALAGADDRIYTFRMIGLPFRNSFAATGNPESDVLVSVVKQTDTLYISRSITNDTIGIPLSDLGQIRSRQVKVGIVDGVDSLHPDTGLAHWILGLVIYKKV